MVLFHMVLLSSYRLFIVTIPLSVIVWLQFAIQILTGGSDPLNFLFLRGDCGHSLTQYYL